MFHWCRRREKQQPINQFVLPVEMVLISGLIQNLNDLFAICIRRVSVFDTLHWYSLDSRDVCNQGGDLV
jgi:hypothetical protein